MSVPQDSVDSVGFVLDPYAEFGPITASANDRPDADKLRLLANWFDMKDEAAGIPADQREVQKDLRRIARLVEVVGVPCTGRCEHGDCDCPLREADQESQ